MLIQSIAGRLTPALLAALVLLALAGCRDGMWNSPYPAASQEAGVIYSSFSERPKHLDPVRAYSSNEYAFIAQIYEPLLQYHFLKRPYQLVPLTTEGMPEVRYFDRYGRKLPAHAPADRIAETEYRIRIQSGINYQPHPALAREPGGQPRYHELGSIELEDIYTLSDFEYTGTRELTAADYIYQIRRMADARLHSPIAGILEEYVVGFSELKKDIAARRAGMEEKDEGFLDLREFQFSGVRQIDRYTFTIRVKGKYPQFLYWLAMPFFAPMPWEADRFYSQPGMEERNLTLHWYPIGTGPFMLAENNPNLRMVLEKNPNFHGELYPDEGELQDKADGLLTDAGKVLPFVDRAVYSLEKESIPYWNKFLQGYYDSSGIASDSFDQAVQFSDQGEVGLTDDMVQRGIGLSTSVTASIYYVGFNMEDPVVGGDSVRARLLRQALSIALDYEEYISIFANGRGIAAQSPIPPGIFGFVEGREGINPVVYDWVDGQPVRKSIDHARDLLARAGYPEGIDQETGKPLILYFDTPATGPDAKARLNWMRKQFEKLGVQLVVRATDYNRFQDKMHKGTSQIFQWGWNADYPDPENFLFLLYGGNAKVEHGGENASNYANPEFDRLFERMKNMDNGPQRQSLINDMVGILQDDAPWVWGFHPKSFSLYHDWYRNVKPNLMANNTLKYKRVDPQRRAEYQKTWNHPVIWPIYVILGILLLSIIPAILKYRQRVRSAAL